MLNSSPSLFQMTKIENYREIFKSIFSYRIYTKNLKLINKKEKGEIINISSSAAHEANIGRSAYASSKLLKFYQELFLGN